jgi:hypothetical protein
MGDRLSENESTASEAELAAAFEFAGLPVSVDRIAANREAYASTLALIRLASVAGLGETSPAAAFKAHWD